MDGFVRDDGAERVLGDVAGGTLNVDREEEDADGQGQARTGTDGGEGEVEGLVPLSAEGMEPVGWRRCGGEGEEVCGELLAARRAGVMVADERDRLQRELYQVTAHAEQLQARLNEIVAAHAEGEEGEVVAGGTLNVARDERERWVSDVEALRLELREKQRYVVELEAQLGVVPLERDAALAELEKEHVFEQARNSRIHCSLRGMPRKLKETLDQVDYLHEAVKRLMAEKGELAEVLAGARATDTDGQGLARTDTVGDVSEVGDFGVALGLVLKGVEQEVLGAVGKHARFASAHEGYAVILEELDELKGEVWKKREERDKAKMQEEAVQVAAMAVRFVLDVI